MDGKTPFEVTMGKKPDLSRLREWGCCVWVRNQESAKLGGHVAEGIWVGFNTKSNGSWIYWPAKKKVSVERNCYFNDITRSSDGLEGEEEVVVEAPRVPPLTSISNSKTPHFEPPSTHQQPPTSDNDNGSQPQAATQVPQVTVHEDQPREHRVRKVSQRVQDILDSRASSSSQLSDPTVPRGVQVPSPLPAVIESSEPEGGGTSEWMMALEEELAMVAEMAKSKALEPTLFTNAN